MNDSPMPGGDMFEPFDRLISIEICGKTCEVPENNSILRCLQFLDMEKISNADLCWNGDCLNCQAWIDVGGREKAVISCRTKAVEGMRIVRLHPEVS